jgi:hypothetical protein
VQRKVQAKNNSELSGRTYSFGDASHVGAECATLRG